MKMHPVFLIYLGLVLGVIYYISQRRIIRVGISPSLTQSIPTDYDTALSQAPWQLQDGSQRPDYRASFFIQLGDYQAA